MNRAVKMLSAGACSLVAMAAACAYGGGGLPLQTAHDDGLAAGRVLAERECSGCHAIGVAGASRNVDAPPLRTLAERYPGSLLADAFPERMKVGHPAMPEFRLSSSDVDALLSYILSIQERRGA